VISLTVGPIELPHTLGHGGGVFKFTTFMKGVNTEELFEVDHGSIDPGFLITPGKFANIVVETASDQA